MAYITLAKPGTINGPCGTRDGYEKDCQHIDCAQTRAMARDTCGGCHKELGYDRPIWKVNGANWHVSCTADIPDPR